MKRRSEIALFVLIAGLAIFFVSRRIRPVDSPSDNSGLANSSVNSKNFSSSKGSSGNFADATKVANSGAPKPASEAQEPQAPTSALSPRTGERRKAIVDPELLEPKGFRAFAKQALKNLPRVNDMGKLSAEEVHDTPALLISKSQSLGDIADALDQNPKLINDAVAFYKKCSLDKTIVIQIRSRCLSHYKRLGPQIGETVDLSVYPPAVLELAEKIP